MSIKEIVCDALRRYGESVELKTKEGSFETFAVIQPLRRKHRLFMNEDRMVPGEFDSSFRHYVGQPSAALCEGDEVLYHNERYAVVMSERYYCGEEIIYIWAILKHKTERVDEYESA